MSTLALAGLAVAALIAAGYVVRLIAEALFNDHND